MSPCRFLKSAMSHVVKALRGLCRHVDFKGQGPQETRPGGALGVLYPGQWWGRRSCGGGGGEGYLELP